MSLVMQVVYITRFYLRIDDCYITNTIASRPMMLMGDGRKQFEALSGLGEICGGWIG
jgi:hypothetical protein